MSLRRQGRQPISDWTVESQSSPQYAERLPIKTLKRLGEFGLIRKLTAGLPQKKGVLGVGDDCAIIRMPGRYDLLITTDMLIEGRHFRCDWSSMRAIGQKAMRVNLSDIAAMGGIPRYAVVAVGLPARLELKEVEGLFSGMKSAAREAKVLLIGGDTNRADKLIISITLLGEVEKGKALQRGGAQVGDFLYVTGGLGKGAVALQKRTLSIPPNRTWVGRTLVQKSLSRCCIDLSDGFLQDLGHILEESQVGAQVWLESLPGKASISLKLSGGEDYELLFTVPPRVKIGPKINGVPVTRVGKITPYKGGIRLRDARDKIVPLPRRRGYTHF